MIDPDALLNATMLANQLEDTFVVFINNPEEDVSSWNDLLTNFKDKSEEKANRGRENSAFSFG